MASNLPTRILAGVTVPDTALIRKAIEYARELSSDSTYNHVLRSFLFGFIIADKVVSSTISMRDSAALHPIQTLTMSPPAPFS